MNSFLYIYIEILKEGEEMEFDTITAISTPMGEGAIAIVRLSGDEAFAIAENL